MPTDPNKEISTILESVQKELLNCAHLEVLNMIAEGSPSTFFNDLKDTFKREWSESMSRLQKACEVSDSTEVRKTVHYLAGSSANLGLKRLHGICCTIEQNIDENNFSAYSVCPEHLQEEYLISMKALEDYIDQL